MRISRFLKQFNWRFLLVRILVNALALAITAIVTPKIYFVDKSIWSWLLMAAVLGVLNALLKPLLQFLTLQFIFVTYGLVIVMVNALILLLLSYLFPDRFAVDNLLWALVGGLVLGLISSFLESLLGLTMPIVPEEETALRRQLEEEASQAGWRTAVRSEGGPEARSLALEPLAPDAEALGPGAPGSDGAPASGDAALAGPGAGGAGEPAAELSAIGPDEGPAPAAVEAEPPEPVVTPPAMTDVPAEEDALASAGDAVDSEPMSEARAEEEEGGS